MFISNVTKALLLTYIVRAQYIFDAPKTLIRSLDFPSKPSDEKKLMNNLITKWAKTIWQKPELGDYESAYAPYDISYYML